jgi:hypothetical protein
MTDAPENISTDAAVTFLIQNQVITDQQLRALPARIAQKLRLSRSQEMLIRNIVLDAIIAISNGADESLAEFTDMAALFRPLDSLTEQSIVEGPDWWFAMMRKAADEQAIREIEINFKMALKGEI